MESAHYMIQLRAMRNMGKNFTKSLFNRSKRILSYVRSLVGPGLYYVVEGNEWVIRRVGEVIIGQIGVLEPKLRCQIVTESEGLYSQIVHFGSIWSFAGNICNTSRTNRLVATVFHGHEGMGRAMRDAIDLLKYHVNYVDSIVTASRMMQKRMEGWGIPGEKIHLIPLGVDLSLFKPPSPEDRIKKRRRLGIQDDAVCIGSFQKDGVGWGSGLEPKLIKGPDVFLEVVRCLSKDYKIFVLLTGPARGYVIKGLEEAGISYCHVYTRKFEEIPHYYHCLDLYLVTSREEGGPQAIPECMATGVPVISTRVGMAPDIIDHGIDGLIVDIEDVEGLVKAGSRIIEDNDLKMMIVNNALNKVRAYDWSVLVRRYLDEIYSPLIREGNGES